MYTSWHPCVGKAGVVLVVVSCMRVKKRFFIYLLLFFNQAKKEVFYLYSRSAKHPRGYTGVMSCTWCHKSLEALDICYRHIVPVAIEFPLGEMKIYKI